MRVPVPKTCRLARAERSELGAIDLNRVGGSVNRRDFLWTVVDHLRRRFVELKLIAHFLEARG